MRLFSRSLLWMAPALMLAAGCGESTEPDTCENVTCGDNASCSAGVCACDSGFEGDATAGCTAADACTATSCSGNGTCDASSGTVVCTCEEGYTGPTCLNCAVGFEQVSGECVAADACADLDCGDFGSCVVDGEASCECDEGYTGPACNLCDEGFKAEDDKCVPKTSCDGMECQDNSTCVLDEGVASCQCDEGFTSEDDACINEKEVDCTDAAPDNGTSVTGTVTVQWNAGAGAWDVAAACEWACDENFFETEEGTCINTRSEDCDDTGTPPENTEYLPGTVEVTYTSAEGWTAPAACHTKCLADYTIDGDACINSRLVDCVDPQVPNADPVAGQVTQTWTDLDGWSAPGACEWTCRENFNDLFDDGQCIDTAEVDCTTDGTLPEGSQWVEARKTITFTSANGWTSSTCAFTCEPGKGPTDAGTCDVEQDVVCISAAPANATTSDAQALVTVTWNDTDKTWSTPGECPWACNDGFDNFNDEGACINERTVACLQQDSLPDGAENIPGDVTITFTDGAWPTPYCDWKCDANHGRVGDECLTEKDVVCDDAPPVNGHSIDPQQLVTVSWIADAGAWTLPTVCDWTCDDGYDNFDEAGACINQRTVACVAPDGLPEGAEIIAADVTITFTDGAWPTPYCDWKCDANHGRVGDECLTEQWVACDASNPPANQQPVDGDVVIEWDVIGQAWTAPAACEFECQDGFDDYFDDGTCANTAVVDCDASAMPEFSLPPEDPSVTITYADGVWSEPAACAWTCIDGYTAADDVCVENVRITECLLDTPPTELFLVGDSTPLLALAAGVGVVTNEPATELVGKLCYTTSTITAPVDPETLPCVDATYDGSIELAADLAVASPGTYNYVFVVSGDDGKTWTGCDVDGIVETTVTPGTVRFALSTSDQLALVRSSSGSGLSLPVDNATVTYVRPAVGSDDAGFFVQADAEGPAVFVKYAGTDVAAGDVLSFTVTRVSETSGDVVFVDTFTDLDLVDLADVSSLVQELSAATDLVSAIGDYESELVSLTGFIAGPFVSAGTDHVAAPLQIDGVQSGTLELRMPATLVGEVFLEEGCLVTVTGPMWRHFAKAQPSAYVADDLEVACPGLQVTGAEATNNTTVVITFNRDVHADWVFDAADHFAIDPVIDLSNPVVAGNTITLTTGAQAEGQSYDLLVSDLYDLAERPLDEDPTLVTFEGVAASTTTSCGWDGTGSAVVISQVYGGGGNAGATYKNDFVELYNRSDAAVDVGGWSVQYASASGSTWSATALTGSIAPGAFYLIKLGGGSTGIDLPGFDVAGTSNMSGSNGKVALSETSAALSGTCPSDLLDFVGFGTTPNCMEGASRAPAGSNNATSTHRTDVCVDTNENGSDFSTATVTPRQGVQ